MAGNSDAQRLERLEEAITGPTVPSADVGVDLVSRFDAAVNACRALGHEGRLIEEMSGVFAEHLEKLLGEFHGRLKERIGELDRVIGKLGKRTPSH
jgi:hypothetical protein